jgi:hypothetical protein
MSTEKSLKVEPTCFSKQTCPLGLLRRQQLLLGMEFSTDLASADEKPLGLHARRHNDVFERSQRPLEREWIISGKDMSILLDRRLL